MDLLPTLCKTMKTLLYFIFILTLVGCGNRIEHKQVVVDNCSFSTIKIYDNKGNLEATIECNPKKEIELPSIGTSLYHQYKVLKELNKEPFELFKEIE